jgi:hypothetical protein
MTLPGVAPFAQITGTIKSQGWRDGKQSGYLAGMV